MFEYFTVCSESETDGLEVMFDAPFGRNGSDVWKKKYGRQNPTFNNNDLEDTLISNATLWHSATANDSDGEYQQYKEYSIEISHMKGFVVLYLLYQVQCTSKL